MTGMPMQVSGVHPEVCANRPRRSAGGQGGEGRNKNENAN